MLTSDLIVLVRLKRISLVEAQFIYARRQVNEKRFSLQAQIEGRAISIVKTYKKRIKKLSSHSIYDPFLRKRFRELGILR